MVSCQYPDVTTVDMADDSDHLEGRVPVEGVFEGGVLGITNHLKKLVLEGCVKHMEVFVLVA